MAGSMLEKEIEVYSEKYNIQGIIRDYGMVTKLFFTYEGKEIVMGIQRNILNDERFIWIDTVDVDWRFTA